jgi:hypothetical protein
VNGTNGRGFTVNDFTPATWMLFGEAYSKSDHLFHVPLRPDMLASEEERYRDRALSAMATLPGSERPTKRLRAQLRDNAAIAYAEIEYDPIHRRSLGLTPQAIMYFNNLLTRDPLSEEGAGAGGRPSLKERQTTFALLQSLCETLNHPAFESTKPEQAFTAVFTKAVLAHLNLATSQFFPTVNAPTAVVLQHGVLIETGMMPRRYAHLLTIFYGTCLDRYQDELDRSDKTGDATTFVDFSIRGFVGQLRTEIEQLRFVWPEQRARIAWLNYVHAVLPERDVDSTRQIALALAIPDEPLSLLRLRQVMDPVYARSGAGPDLLQSDLAALIGYGVVRRGTNGWRPNRHLLDD